MCLSYLIYSQNLIECTCKENRQPFMKSYCFHHSISFILMSYITYFLNIQNSRSTDCGFLCFIFNGHSQKFRERLLFLFANLKINFLFLCGPFQKTCILNPLVIEFSQSLTIFFSTHNILIAFDEFSPRIDLAEINIYFFIMAILPSLLII